MQSRFTWLFFVVLLTGCTHSGGGGGDTKFLLPWRNVNGTYQLQEVTIETLASPEELRGEAAEIYDQNELSDAGFAGSIARPHLTKSGDVWVPMDAESAIAVAAYAQFDQLFKYERAQGTRSQISWPRRVGIELNMTGPDIAAHNNAHYFTQLDAIGLMPSTRGGVPVSLNHGIVAHEHFHAHFQSQVMNVVAREHEPVIAAIERMFYPFFSFAAAPNFEKRPSSDNPRSMNMIVLRAWNEGLADVFAGIYTGDPNFFAPSLPQVGWSRSLTLPETRLATGEMLQSTLMSQPLTDDQITGTAYAQGSLLARMMFKLAMNGTESPDSFSARMLGRIAAIPEAVAGKMDHTVMDFEDVVPVLLDGFPLSVDSCGALSGTVSPEMMKGSFKACGVQ